MLPGRCQPVFYQGRKAHFPVSIAQLRQFVNLYFPAESQGFRCRLLGVTGNLVHGADVPA